MVMPKAARTAAPAQLAAVADSAHVAVVTAEVAGRYAGDPWPRSDRSAG
ncbi:hypothetical protein IW256_002888 [Actinomadura viridis]|uniref:Uncharacterized protein n=1 Tax=Actinomadura viridis TaxID=58110 RepID=A0A931GIZ6_9ACTN|nr:hypothetical protein [Actinomadura viridis]